MVRDEEYVDFLKLIVSCISQGDYCSAKELSNLELEKMSLKNRITELNRNKIYGKGNVYRY